MKDNNFAKMKRCSPFRGILISFEDGLDISWREIWGNYVHSIPRWLHTPNSSAIYDKGNNLGISILRYTEFKVGNLARSTFTPSLKTLNLKLSWWLLKIYIVKFGFLSSYNPVFACDLERLINILGLQYYPYIDKFGKWPKNDWKQFGEHPLWFDICGLFTDRELISQHQD